MESIRTISCKLQVDPHQAERIEATLQAFADACNFVAGVSSNGLVAKNVATKNG